MDAVRSIAGTEDRIEGLGMPWGGPFNGKDIEGEFFSSKTDFAFDWFKERPLLYQHGMDDGTKTAVIGRVKGWSVKEDEGVWAQAQLDQSNQYFKKIKELIAAGKLFFSSGAMRHLVDVNAKSGEIKRWPWVELSLTPTPANLFAQVETKTAQEHFDIAGIKADLEALTDGKTVWTAAFMNDLPDSAFAYIEPGGEKDEEGKTKPRSLRHFPYKGPDGKLDEAHVRNALGRIPQSTLPQAAKDKALAIIRRAAESLDIHLAGEEKAALPEDSLKIWEETENEIRYQVHDPDGFADDSFRTVKLKGVDGISAIMAKAKDGEANGPMRIQALRFKKDEGWTEEKAKAWVKDHPDVKAVFTPTWEDIEPMPLTDKMEAMENHVGRFLEDTKGLLERRVKEGRVLSTINRQHLQKCLDTMKAAYEELDGLLKSSQPAAQADLDRAFRRLSILRLMAS